ncbi:MAG: NADPH-dependent glutamate synthase [Fidelibacterota bacterium]|nr:MAG: NADPH-dependent glutamate synthase [Candidatus Neomarinimicrobiota bacterium]
MRIPRQDMPEQDPNVRNRNFDEVNLGFDADTAVQEGLRCLQCKKPLCIDGCPVKIKIPEFIQLIVERDFPGAAAKIKEDNSLPAVCGRVCPQETQCEATCVVGNRFRPVAIGHLERFVADHERESGKVQLPKKAKATGKKVAIVGSGPAGLACATDLVQWGHEVTVYEALHEYGGVLVYGIPEFRLPKKILGAEIDNLRNMGVNFVKNFIIGKTMTVDELMGQEGYDAVFVGTGAGLPWFMNIPGENLNGVYSANEFLTRVNLMKANNFPQSDTPIKIADTVVVFGGGNTAMDAVRTAKRLGAERAIIVYRRSEEEMPARDEEIKHAKEEGIEFMLLTAPTKMLDDGKGWVKGVECLKMELGEPDQSGRRRPMPIEGSEFTIDADLAVVAIGNGSNPLLAKTTPGLKINRWGNIIADAETGRTSKKGVFAGGDIVTGGATVILAMGAGRQAAAAMHEYLETGEWVEIDG